MIDLKYSQNFYTNYSFLQKMIASSNFFQEDTILDIGAGEGVITKEIYKYSKNIIAYELDSRYLKILKENTKSINIDIHNENFLDTPLPNKPFKVFSNIPFSQTTQIISKLTDTHSQLEEAYLFVQKEASERYTGNPVNTQIATILSYEYEIIEVYELDRRDFRPIPDIDIAVIRIKRRDIQDDDYLLYRDFVTYIFNQTNGYVLDTLKKLFTFKQIGYIKKELEKNYYKKPSHIPSKYFLELFKYFKTNGEDYRKKVEGYYSQYNQKHSNREKVFRKR